MSGPRTSPDPKVEGGSHWDEDLEGDDPHLADGSNDAPGPGRPRRASELPPWARFPRVAGVPEGPAFAPPEGTPNPQARREETARILEVLDRLGDEMRRPGDAPPVPAPAAAPPAPSTAPEVPVPRPVPVPDPIPEEEPGPVDLWESPNLYLEERLRLANAAATEIGRDVREIDATWARVVGAMAILEGEVHKANEEMAFIRASGRTGSATTLELPSRPAPLRRPLGVRPPTSQPAPAAPSFVPAEAAHAPYTRFTADRYNRTIALLKARRRRLAGWTFLSAGLISIALVALTALSQEAWPPLWLAVLPAVWMIPVPFFVLSFRGTQRVLRHNHLEVPAEAR